MAKTGKTSTKRPTSSKASKTKAISKSKSGKATTTCATPARKSSSSKSKLYGPAYEKSIRLFKTQGDYFSLNSKYSKMYVLLLSLHHLGFCQSVCSECLILTWLLV